jgi:hypothetical protein
MPVALMSKEDRQIWLEEEIWVNGITKAARKEVLHDFAEVLCGCLERRGYKVLYEMSPYACISKWMYLIYIKTYFMPHLKFSFDPPIHRNWKEDRYEFDHVMSGAVDTLMEEWKEVEGFDEDTPVGRELWMGMEDFLYHLADIDNSKYSSRVESMLFGSDSDGSDDEYRGRHSARGRGAGGGRRALKKADDVYNQETAQGYHYDERHRA